MKLYTSVDIAPSEKKIGYDDKILLLGSCFADNIGAKFCEYYFQTTINPFGTLYNPASIATTLNHSIQPSTTLNHSIQPFTIHHNGLWHSMMHHGSFSHPDKDVLIARCEESQTLLRTALRDATTIIVTFGTSWVYEMDGLVVANCHKLPADRFVRRCLTVQEIVDMWLPIIQAMPDKHWIFTVSPIRHLKDGLHANQISKAILLQAIDHLTQISTTLYPSIPSSTTLYNPIPSSTTLYHPIPSNTTQYFPSYEIMLDELRDYRFYAEDMVHPSQVAVDYIWQRFVDTYMTADTQGEMRTLHQLWLDRQHRFLHPESEEAMKFEQRIAQKMQDLQPKYPWLR